MWSSLFRNVEQSICQNQLTTALFRNKKKQEAAREDGARWMLSLTRVVCLSSGWMLVERRTWLFVLTDQGFFGFDMLLMGDKDGLWNCYGGAWLLVVDMAVFVCWNMFGRV